MLGPRASAGDAQGIDLDTGKIKEWRSIVTLIVFVLTSEFKHRVTVQILSCDTYFDKDINVLFPFHIPIYVPRAIWTVVLNIASAARIIRPPRHPTRVRNGNVGPFVRFDFPMNFITAPLVADLFLLAILAIGADEVSGGTKGTQGIVPYDIMLFFLSLAYIAISVDASGLIRWLAFKVLQKGGKVGHRLFFYLYVFFFALTSFIGNDPIILSGTAFLSYMTRVSSNIKHPRAWIYTQFSVANIASAILVSSNPTNLVLAGAFGIKFVNYTANIIVPVLITGIVLYPFLLYIIFHDESLIPSSIEMEDLPEELKNRKPVNPNIPFAKGEPENRNGEPVSDEDQEKQLSLEEILNPFLDRKGAIFGAAIMAATLVTVLGLNAASQGSHERPVYWVTLPAAFIMFCFDLGMGWHNREETRKIAHAGRQRSEDIQAERRRKSIVQEDSDAIETHELSNRSKSQPPTFATSSSTPDQENLEKHDPGLSTREEEQLAKKTSEPTTLASLVADAYTWAQETFPTTMTVFHHLPLALVPFAFCMFILVQGLVTKGWVPVFAHGWDHWVEKTGTVGAIGGMGFISVILCNVRPPSSPLKTTNSLTNIPVRRNKHRHHNPHLPRHPNLASNPPTKQHSHIRPYLLGHHIQHGARRQLRRVQSRIQRVPCRDAVARHSSAETHSCRWAGICEGEFADYCDYDASRVDGADGGDLYYEGGSAVYCFETGVRRNR